MNEYSYYSITGIIEKNKIKERKEQKKKHLNFSANQLLILNHHDSPQRQMFHALSVVPLFSADQTCFLEATHKQTHSQKSKASQFPRENVK